jgi:N-methylhydantoinase A
MKRLKKEGFKGILLLMQSNGGIMSPEVAMDHAVTTLLSGPAGGPEAGLFYAEIHGIRNIITADMGGTSFDVSVKGSALPHCGIGCYMVGSHYHRVNSITQRGKTLRMVS